MNETEKGMQAVPKQSAKALPLTQSNGTGQKEGAQKENIRHSRDISSKTVFGNAVLCAQFLRDNIRIPALKNIRPEDIEDVSERYRPYLGTEFDSDSVKKIRILGIGRTEKTDLTMRRRDGADTGGREPEFLVSLIEHKSLVDYDVSMQLLRYMMCIWTEYRREMEMKQEGCTRRKGFRYPLIIPIVYYEGKENWTAGRQLRDRVRQEPGLREWIPDFRYEVVRVHDYSDQELLDRGNEMSLIMLMNKIQNADDLDKFVHLPADEVNRILQDSPEQVVDILVSVIENLCFKIDVSDEERTQCVRKVRARNMGYLFENMEKFSIQEMRREVEKKWKEERQKTEAERQKAENERQKAENERQKAENERIRAEEAEKKLKIAEETIRLLQQKALSEK